MTLIRIMSSAFHGLTVFALLAIVCLTPIRAAAGSVPDETGLSLDGTWRIQPANGQEREIAVPSFWERSPGLANVHQVTYRREFEVPESFGGAGALDLMPWATPPRSLSTASMRAATSGRACHS